MLEREESQAKENKNQSFENTRDSFISSFDSLPIKKIIRKNFTILDHSLITLLV
jgi:hypothetical protein